MELLASNRASIFLDKEKRHGFPGFHECRMHEISEISGIPGIFGRFPACSPVSARDIYTGLSKATNKT
jgi:hypothetical protein